MQSETIIFTAHYIRLIEAVSNVSTVSNDYSLHVAHQDRLDSGGSFVIPNINAGNGRFDIEAGVRSGS